MTQQQQQTTMNQQIETYIQNRDYIALIKYIEKENIPVDRHLADRILEQGSNEASAFYFMGNFKYEGFVSRIFENHPLNLRVNKNFVARFSAKDIILNENHNFVDTIRKSVECDAPGEAMVIALFAANKNAALIPELNREMEAFKETHPNTYGHYMRWVSAH